MGLFSLEHSKMAYRADFVLYGLSVLALAAFLLVEGPPAQRLELIGLTAVGLLIWSPIEYVLHRFVMHGVQPFRRWHVQHHARPTALICAPTILSATLIGSLVFLPALGLAGVWRACALTLGVLISYLGYAITHHAIHHWRIDNAWLKRRQRWHARHHHTTQTTGYGVTSAFWDQVSGTAHPASPPPPLTTTQHAVEHGAI